MTTPNINELRGLLSSLKLGASPKRWGEQPEGVAEHCGYLFSCCIENGQVVLGVSPTTEPEVEPKALREIIIGIFGEPKATWHTRYPKRGMTVLYQWGLS